MNKIEDITSVTFMDKDEAIEKGLIKIIGKEVDDAYISMLKSLSVNPDLAKSVGENFKIVYTPLHGSG
ncbi:phospho-sugar mutase, partial [Klebsiella pneumoniae]